MLMQPRRLGRLRGAHLARRQVWAVAVQPAGEGAAQQRALALPLRQLLLQQLARARLRGAAPGSECGVQQPAVPARGGRRARRVGAPAPLPRAKAWPARGRAGGSRGQLPAALEGRLLRRLLLPGRT
jgi:hypothetical protein